MKAKLLKGFVSLDKSAGANGALAREMEWLELQKKKRAEAKALKDKEKHDRLLKEEEDKLLQEEIVATGRVRALDTLEERRKQLQEEIAALEDKKAGKTQEQIDELEKREEKAKEMEERAKQMHSEAESQAKKMLEERQADLAKIKEAHEKELKEVSEKRRQELLDFRHRLGLDTPPGPKRPLLEPPKVRSLDPRRIYEDVEFWKLPDDQKHYLESLTCEKQWELGFGPYEATSDEIKRMKADGTLPENTKVDESKPSEVKPAEPPVAPFARRRLPGEWPFASPPKEEEPTAEEQLEQLPPPKFDPRNMPDFWLVSTAGVPGYDVIAEWDTLQGYHVGGDWKIDDKTTPNGRKKILAHKANEMAHAVSDLIEQALDEGANAVLNLKWNPPQTIDEEMMISCTGTPAMIERRVRVRPSEWAKVGDKPRMPRGKSEPTPVRPKLDEFDDILNDPFYVPSKTRRNYGIDPLEHDIFNREHDILNRERERERERSLFDRPVGRSTDPLRGRSTDPFRRRSLFDDGKPARARNPREKYLRGLDGTEFEDPYEYELPQWKPETSRWKPQRKSDWRGAYGQTDNGQTMDDYVEAVRMRMKQEHDEEVMAERQRLDFISKQMTAAAMQGKQKGNNNKQDAGSQAQTQIPQKTADAQNGQQQNGGGKKQKGGQNQQQQQQQQQQQGQAQNQKQQQQQKKKPDDDAFHQGQFTLVSPRPEDPKEKLWDPTSTLADGIGSQFRDRYLSRRDAEAEKADIESLQELLRGSMLGDRLNVGGGSRAQRFGLGARGSLPGDRWGQQPTTHDYDLWEHKSNESKLWGQ